MRGVWIAGAFALVLGACADGASKSGGEDSAGRDANPVPLDNNDAEVIEPDAAVDAGATGGEFGDACQDNLDCLSGWCVDAPNGSVCTVRCLDEGCPEDWSCRVVRNTGADVVSICLPPEAPDAAAADAEVAPVDAEAVAPDAAVVVEPDAEVVLEPDAEAPPPVDAMVPPPVDAMVPPPVDAMVPPPVDAMVPPPVDAMIPPPVDAMIPPPVDAMVPPPVDAMIPPPVDAMLPPPVDAMVPPPVDAMLPPPVDAEVDAAPPLLGYGQPCDAAAQCESNICLNQPGFGGWCSDVCARDVDCPGFDVCRGAEGQQVCARNDTGRNCADGCIDGLCSEPPSGVPWVDLPPQCLMFCTGGNKCPPGYDCGNLQTPQGVVRACVPASPIVEICLTGQNFDCLGALGCNLGNETCQVPEGTAGIAGYCTCNCQSQLDCPAGFACERFGALGTCRPIAGQVCHGRDGIQPASECYSQTCLERLDDANENICVAFCAVDGDCPPDYLCEEVEPGISVCTTNFEREVVLDAPEE
jgi:hypothetical protein